MPARRFPPPWSIELMDIISRSIATMTQSKIIAGVVVAVLAASAVRAEVVTLVACQFVKTVGVGTPSSPTQLTVIIDLDAGTMGGREGTTEKVKISENMVSWMVPDPFDTTRCQMGGINRITGEFGQQILKKTCQQIGAANFDG